MVNILDLSIKTRDLFDKARDKFYEIEDKLDINSDISNVLDDMDALLDDVDERKIRLTFVGQYSAGKSSIIKMLTGINDIEIGADITTQKRTVYEWNGMEIVDTPGVATGIREDHDEITYKAIQDSDLLVYVITCEGFNPDTIKYFCELAYGEGQAGNALKTGKLNEMILVVNKMSRIGNNRERREILLNDLKKYLPEEVVDNLKIVFLDAQSYNDSVDEEDKEYKDILVERSGYDFFIKALSEFAEEKGLVAKVVAPVNKLDDILKDTLSKIKGSTGDPRSDAAESIVRESIRQLRKRKLDGEEVLLRIFRQYADRVKEYGRDAANRLEDGADGGGTALTKEEAEAFLKDVTEECNRKIQEALLEIMDEINSDFKSLTEDEYTAKVFGLNAGTVEDGIFDKNKETFHKLTNITSELLKKIDKNVILKIGHLLGKNFKPWEAANLAKALAKGAKFLAVFAQILSIIIDIRNKQKEDEALDNLKKCKREIISVFDGIASDMLRTGRSTIEEIFSGPLQEIIEQQEEVAQEYDRMKKNVSRFTDDVRALRDECNELKKSIRSRFA